MKGTGGSPCRTVSQESTISSKHLSRSTDCSDCSPFFQRRVGATAFAGHTGKVDRVKQVHIDTARQVPLLLLLAMFSGSRAGTEGAGMSDMLMALSSVTQAGTLERQWLPVVSVFVV